MGGDASVEEGGDDAICVDLMALSHLHSEGGTRKSEMKLGGFALLHIRSHPVDKISRDVLVGNKTRCQWDRRDHPWDHGANSRKKG